MQLLLLYTRGDLKVLCVGTMCVSDRAGARALREHATARVVRQQLQEIWGDAGDRDGQKPGGLAVCEGLRRDRR